MAACADLNHDLAAPSGSCPTCLSQGRATPAAQLAAAGAPPQPSTPEERTR